MRLAPYVHSIALLGVNLSEAKIEEIEQYAKDYTKILICLDNDATYEAIKLQLKWHRRLPNLLVYGLHKDVKDMTEEEFTHFLERTNE